MGIRMVDMYRRRAGVRMLAWLGRMSVVDGRVHWLVRICEVGRLMMV